ncbi:MAG: nitroreductase family protein [Sphaerochaetaceae bacterium]|nr:nitroreductase family protein [Sphaerochaetaceae bacterium]
MNEVLNQLLNRRTVRSFDKRDISEEDFKSIKKAIMRAPTGGNMTFYSVINVKDQLKKDELAILCDNQPMIATAPLVLVFLADMQKWMDYIKYCKSDEKSGIPFRKPGVGDFHLAMQDAVIAAQSGVVAADSLGIGSCYIGDIIENYEKIQKLLNLPPQAAPACMLIMGYNKSNAKVNLLDRCSEDLVFMDDEYKSFTKDELDEGWEKPLERLQKANRLPYEGATLADSFYTRKYSTEFMKEMNRSVEVFLDRWKR